MRHGDKGADVLEMQEALLANGYDLPIYGADGHYGDETQAALEVCAMEHKIKMSQPVPKELLDIILWDAPEDPEVPAPPPPTLAVEVFDLRNEPWSKRNHKKFKRAGGNPVIRDPSTVKGITIHQTAVKYCVADYQVQAAGGDIKQALANRSLQVACHMMAFHDGFVAWPNPLLWYVYHGNGWNATELGLEIDGCYPGVIGGKTWNGKKATQVTEKVVLAARAAIELMVREGRSMGMPIEYIHAHRQSSATRRDDPGEELWNRVVLEFCVPVLGLRTEPERAIGNGRPVPLEWDPNGKGSY